MHINPLKNLFSALEKLLPASTSHAEESSDKKNAIQAKANEMLKEAELVYRQSNKILNAEERSIIIKDAQLGVNRALKKIGKKTLLEQGIDKTLASSEFHQAFIEDSKVPLYMKNILTKANEIREEHKKIAAQEKLVEEEGQQAYNDYVNRPPVLLTKDQRESLKTFEEAIIDFQSMWARRVEVKRPFRKQPNKASVDSPHEELTKKSIDVKSPKKTASSPSSAMTVSQDHQQKVEKFQKENGEYLKFRADPVISTKANEMSERLNNCSSHTEAVQIFAEISQFLLEDYEKKKGEKGGNDELLPATIGFLVLMNNPKTILISKFLEEWYYSQGKQKLKGELEFPLMNFLSAINYIQNFKEQYQI